MDNWTPSQCLNELEVASTVYAWYNQVWVNEGTSIINQKLFNKMHDSNCISVFALCRMICWLVPLEARRNRGPWSLGWRTRSRGRPWTKPWVLCSVRPPASSPCNVSYTSLNMVDGEGGGGGGGREKNRERDLFSIVICHYFNIIMEGFNSRIL